MSTGATNTRCGAGCEASGRDGIACQITGRPAVGMGVHSAAVPTLAAIDVDTRAWASPRHAACIALVAASAHDRDEYAQFRSK